MGRACLLSLGPRPPPRYMENHEQIWHLTASPPARIMSGLQSWGLTLLVYSHVHTAVSHGDSSTVYQRLCLKAFLI